MKRKDTSPAVRATAVDFLDGDGYASDVFRSVGDPFPSLVEAAAGWESFRVATWELWGDDVRNPGIRRGPFLRPPGGSAHDGITDTASRDYWPKKGTDPARTVAACDADLQSIERFRKERPHEAKAIAGPLDLFVSQLHWLRNAALRAGRDYKRGDALLYGAAPTSTNEIDDDDSEIWRN